jgi:hypothetical protein
MALLAMARLAKEDVEGRFVERARDVGTGAAKWYHMAKSCQAGAA